MVDGENGGLRHPGNGGVRREAPGEGLPPPPPGFVVLRVDRVRGEIVVAACDSELVDTELRVGRTPVKVSSHFYGRITVNEQEFAQQVRRGSIVNHLGERTIGWAVRAGH